MVDYLKLEKNDFVFNDKIIKVDKYFYLYNFWEPADKQSRKGKEFARHLLWITNYRYYVVYHDGTISKKFVKFGNIIKR